MFFCSLMHLLENKRETPLSGSKEIRKLRLNITWVPKLLLWEGNQRSHPFTLLSASILGLKAGKSCFKRSNLWWIHCQPHPSWDSVAPVSFSNRLAQTCIMATYQNARRQEQLHKHFSSFCLCHIFWYHIGQSKSQEFIPESEWSTLQSYVVKTWKWTRWKIGTIFEIYHTYPYYFPAIS